MGSKPSGTTTSTQNTTPWGPQQPYLEDIFTESQGLYQGTPPQYYPGMTYAPTNDWQNTGAVMMASPGYNTYYTDIAANANAGLASGSSLYGNPATGMYTGFAGDNFGTNTSINPAASTQNWFMGNNLADVADYNSPLNAYAQGDYVAQDNPYTQDLVDSITADVLPGIQAQFINSGTLSSPEAARASAEGVTEGIAPELFARQQQEEQNQIAAANALAGRYMQGGALQAETANNAQQAGLQGRSLQQQAAGGLSQTYQSGIDDQLAAIGLMPQTYQGMFAPGQNLFAAGTTQQQLQQQQINDSVARWNFEQSLPWDMLNQYIGQVTGNYGGTSTLTQPYFTNPTQSVMSGLGAVGSLAKL